MTALAIFGAVVALIWLVLAACWGWKIWRGDKHV